MANSYNVLPTKEEYMKMIRKNIGIFNNLSKGKQGCKWLLLSQEHYAY